MSNLLQRVLAAAVFGPVLVGLFWYGGVPLLVGVGLIVAGGIWEFCRMLAQKTLQPWPGIAIVAALGWCITAHIYGLDAFAHYFTALLLFMFVVALFRGQIGWRLANAGATLLVVLYAGFLGSFVLLVRNLPIPHNQIFAVLILVGIWISDTAAYFCGRWFGRWHPFPNISPGKTEAGFIGGGLITLLALGYGLHTWVEMSLTQSLTIGLLVGIGSPVGDLIESMIKRDMNVKDTSTLIPGHGGMLDRFDSLFFVFPLIYLYLKIVQHL